MMPETSSKRIHISIGVLAALFLSACQMPTGAGINPDAAATAVQQTVQSAVSVGGSIPTADSSGGLQPISPENLTATDIASANQPPPTAAGADQPAATPTAQSDTQGPDTAPTATASDNQQPTAPPPMPTSTPLPSPTSPPPPTQGPPQPSSSTSAYVELYDYPSSNQGVDLDNSGGLDEMAYNEYDSSDLNPGHAIGQLGGRGTVWADMGASAPSYEDCISINSWNPGIFISQGNYYCYITDQSNYGYLRVDRLEQIGTGGSELQPWVLGVSFTTWIP